MSCCWTTTLTGYRSEQSNRPTRPISPGLSQLLCLFEKIKKTWSSWRFCSKVGKVPPLTCSAFNHLVCCVVYCQVLEISAVEMSAGTRWHSACGAQSPEKKLDLKTSTWVSFQKSWPVYLKIIRTCCEQFDGGTFIFFLLFSLTHQQYHQAEGLDHV